MNFIIDVVIYKMINQNQSPSEFSIRYISIYLSIKKYLGWALALLGNSIFQKKHLEHALKVLTLLVESDNIYINIL